MIELCCEYDVHMLNGRLFDDIEGNITCTANDGRSIVDYIIASSNLFELFSTFAVDNYEWKTNLITDMLFIRIMSSTDKESIVAISKYLVSALSYRNTCISSSD